MQANCQQETSDFPCDTPLDLEDLRKEFEGDGKVDLSLITDESNVKVRISSASIYTLHSSC